ncbi:MAG: NAD(P)/FAD-dependent oxidoreductase [Gammaproteobacteria bacterium]
MQQLVIIGGGFAGLWAALVAAREAHVADRPLAITLVAPDDALTVRPRLYEPFTPAFRAPFAPLFEPLGIAQLRAHATDLDTVARCVRVQLADGASRDLPYDRVVLAAGSRQAPLPVAGAAEHALDLDTYVAAERFHAHLAAVVAAPVSPATSTFVVIGGGFTGIEMACELRRHLRALGATAAARDARVVLVERATEIGPELGAGPRATILEALQHCGVELRLGAQVSRIEADAVTFQDGERLPCATTVIATGLRAHPLTGGLGVELDGQGRLPVDEHLEVIGAPGVYAAGDLARARVDDAGHVALMSCQHAVPQGKHAGYNAAHALLGLAPRAYRQPDYVTCLDLGDYGAVFTTGWERTVAQAGADVKALKQTVNTQWIYPPKGDLETLLAACDIDAPWPPV